MPLLEVADYKEHKKRNMISTKLHEQMHSNINAMIWRKRGWELVINAQEWEGSRS